MEASVRRFGIALVCSTLQLGLTAAWASDVRIVSQKGANDIVIEAHGATTDEVLAVLAREFRFGVEGSGDSGQPVRFTGQLQGSLESLLQRLLRHRGYMVVRSSDNPGGVRRVVLFDAKEGPLPAVLPPHAGHDAAGAESQSRNPPITQPSVEAQAAPPGPASSEAGDQRRANGRPLFSRWSSR
jgi:hypothetical protein